MVVLFGLAALTSIPQHADAAACAGDTAAPAGAIWTACLTVERQESISASGFAGSDYIDGGPFGELSPDSFSAGVEFITVPSGLTKVTVAELILGDTGRLSITFWGPTVTVGGILHVGGTSFAMADANRFGIVSPPLARYEWSDTGLSWSDGQNITVALVPPRQEMRPRPESKLRFDEETVLREIAEESPPGTAIGEPVSAVGGKPGPVTYVLEGHDGQFFDIDAQTGQIRTKQGVDYDHEKKVLYVVEVRARNEHGESAQTEVRIRITDLPEIEVQEAYVVEGRDLTLIYDHRLDENSVPPHRPIRPW